MSNVTLFYQEFRDFYMECETGFLSFDLVMSESHNMESDVSSHPIEDGSEVSDHIHNKMEFGQMTCLISNFTLKRPGLVSNRAQDAFDLLTRLWKKRELFTLTTVLRVYTDIAITSLQVERSSDTGEALVIAIAFRQVKKVQLKTVLIDASIKPGAMTTDSAKQAAPKADLSRQTPVGTR